MLDSFKSCDEKNLTYMWGFFFVIVTQPVKTFKNEAQIIAITCRTLSAEIAFTQTRKLQGKSVSEEY